MTCRRDRCCWLQLTEQQPAMSLRRRRRRIRWQRLRGQRRQRRDQHNYKSVGEATQRMRTTRTMVTGGESGKIVPNCAFNFGHFHLRATRLISLASCTTLGLTICYHFCLRSSRSPFSYSFISFSFISFHFFFGADSIIWRCYRGCRMDHRYLRTCVCMCVRAVFVLLLCVESVCV